jgi:hypothetical protein
MAPAVCLVPVSFRSAADDDDGTRRVCDEVLADRAEQQAGKSAMTAGALNE